MMKYNHGENVIFLGLLIHKDTANSAGVKRVSMPDLSWRRCKIGIDTRQ